MFLFASDYEEHLVSYAAGTLQILDSPVEGCNSVPPNGFVSRNHMNWHMNELH